LSFYDYSDNYIKKNISRTSDAGLEKFMIGLNRIGIPYIVRRQKTASISEGRSVSGIAIDGRGRPLLKGDFCEGIGTGG
jgi:hypothetical protein